MTYQTMSRTNDMITPVQALGLMASVYLVIRGFDNYKKDLDERKKKTEQTAEAA